MLIYLHAQGNKKNDRAYCRNYFDSFWIRRARVAGVAGSSFSNCRVSVGISMLSASSFLDETLHSTQQTHICRDE